MYCTTGLKEALLALPALHRAPLAAEARMAFGITDTCELRSLTFQKIKYIHDSIKAVNNKKTTNNRVHTITFWRVRVKLSFFDSFGVRWCMESDASVMSGTVAPACQRAARASPRPTPNCGRPRALELCMCGLRPLAVAELQRAPLIPLRAVESAPRQQRAKRASVRVRARAGPSQRVHASPRPQAGRLGQDSSPS